jgi:hypothetical protein
VCGGALDQTSPTCSELNCTTPLPDQRDLGDTGENDCQRQIGAAGIRYLVGREKLLEKCALAGLSRATCLADLEVQVKLDKLEQRKVAGIKRKCGNREPAASPPFCCRTGMGNSCTVVATRDDCVLLSGQVQEDKVCGVGNTCDPQPGNKKVTWWEYCPQEDFCPGTALTSIDDLIGCVDSAADEIADQLLCLQFRGGGWPCP